MNKLTKGRKVLIIIISLVILVFLLIIVTKIFNKPTEKPLEKGVYIVDGYRDPESVTIKGRKLKKEKCLKDICVSNIVIETTDNYNMVTYIVKNKGTANQSGYLKIDFGKVDAIIMYSDLKPGEKITTYSSSTKSLKNTKDYKIEELSMDDYMSIVKTKK